MNPISVTTRAGRHRLLGRVAATLVTVVTTVAPAVAPAEPPPSPPPAGYLSSEVRARMDAQLPLKTAAGRIQWSIERADATGYAGIGLGTAEVVVWWKGALPQTVEATIAEVRRTTPVRVVTAEHSRVELEDASKAVEHYLQINPRSPYHGIDIAYDGSGLIINADPAQARSTRLPDGMDIPTGIRVLVTERQRPRLTGRLDDSAPYWGGGRIRNNDTGDSCTAGFPVTAGGATYMLTAAHCGRTGGGWNNGNNTRFFGVGGPEHMAHDLLLVYASVAGRIWDGGVGSGEFTKGVAGWDWVWPGEWLCTSGSITGALCNHVVSNTFVYSFCDYDAYGNYECVNDLILAWQHDGLTASRPGDSGGPVFGLSGSDRVIAKGIISGGIGTTGLIFQDFATAWRDFGITPLTS